MIAHMIPALALAATMTCEAEPDGDAPQPECEPEPPIIEAPPPTRVFMGVDCTKPFIVGLPDDVLTECEGEFTGR